MGADSMRPSETSVPDGWALLVGHPRDRVKPLTYDLRKSTAAIAALGDEGVQPDDAFALDWRRLGGRESFLVLVASGRLITVDPLTSQVAPASRQDAQRVSSEVAYAKALLEGPLMIEECAVLTQWLRESSDPLPRRLRSEFSARQVLPTGLAVADALIRNIDEVLILALSDRSGPLELTYDFSVGLSEDVGVIRNWRALGSDEMATFGREFAVAARLLSSSP